MFWSVIREQNHGTNIQTLDIPEEQISLSAFLPRMKTALSEQEHALEEETVEKPVWRL